MKKSGYADLPLHNGRVPRWLAERMSRLGGAIVEAIILEYGKSEVIRRLSDPAWFQSLGCVLGMDWHSSGITTSVMGALKAALNPRAKELGIYICGGRGKHSRQTPNELLQIANVTGLNGTELVKNSRLAAKVDNTMIQDGFQIYLHSFILSDEGEWTVVQQGMNGSSGYARRYHWHSAGLKSFTEEPHTFIYGHNRGQILNLTAQEARETKSGILNIASENPDRMIAEIRKIQLPRHHDVRQTDVDIKRLGAILALAQELPTRDFESLLLLQGLGPRTLQSLTLVSEVIYGTASRFSDPARFSFAHGGKDGHPFPVPTKVYDESINVLRHAVDKAKLDSSDRVKAIQSLSKASEKLERDFQPSGNLESLIEKERNDSWKYGGRTVLGWAKKPDQLTLFN
ncbi:DUF763 domain-containing protein [Marinoscillum sp. MHG1-6]|uniref:DUF763 domain-containing protein n=1 Tax=Marinoscillum sp. MHG1-6 TaxID=2959627 RepID=UPI0021571508|nr:DUF763 domain-containing protein [Marinoscillum sp. MHG1-6]